MLRAGTSPEAITGASWGANPHGAPISDLLKTDVDLHGQHHTIVVNQRSETFEYMGTSN